MVSFSAVARWKMVLPSLSGVLRSWEMLGVSVKYLTASYWLFFTPRCKTVSPCSVLISADWRLTERTSSMMLTRPFMAAQWRGVRPSLSCKEVRSGSNLRSSLVISRWPLLQARCKGVHPWESFFHEKSGLSLIIFLTTSAK